MKTFIIKYQDGNIIKEKIVDTNDISKEKLPLNIIDIKEKKDKFLKVKNKKLNHKRVIYIFYELNLMLQSNIVLVEALDILIKNQKDEQLKSFLVSIKSSFINNISFEKNLNKYKVDKLVSTFLELSKKSGNIKENIKILSELLFEIDELKKKFKKAISYPLVLREC